MLFSNHLICGPSKYTITFRFAPNHPIITVIITACVSWIIRSILTPLIRIEKKFRSRKNQKTSLTIRRMLTPLVNKGEKKDKMDWIWCVLAV